MNQLFNMGISDKDKEAYEHNMVEYNKEFSKIMKVAKTNAKRTHCYLCNKEVTSFCNSHSLPQFILTSISDNGYVMTPNSFLGLPFLKEEEGLRSAGTFQIICRDCDSSVFSDYETPDNYSNHPTPRMLMQIAMKTELKNIAKKQLEFQLFDAILEHLSKKGESDLRFAMVALAYARNLPEIKSKALMDYEEYKNEFNCIKRGLDSASELFDLFYYETLDYVVPIGFQSSVALVSDFEDNIINNIYEESSDYEMEHIHICIFPLENSSVIFTFIKKSHERHGNFIKQFNSLEKEQQLAALNYIIFTYSEEVFFHTSVKEEAHKDELLKQHISQTTIGIGGESKNLAVNMLNLAVKEHSLTKINSIPNFLSQEYKISKE